MEVLVYLRLVLMYDLRMEPSFSLSFFNFVGQFLF